MQREYERYGIPERVQWGKSHPNYLSSVAMLLFKYTGCNYEQTIHQLHQFRAIGKYFYYVQLFVGCGIGDVTEEVLRSVAIAGMEVLIVHP